MNLSDYQIVNVIKTYIRNMRGKVEPDESGRAEGSAPDAGIASEDGMRRIVFDRIEEIVTEKVKKHEAQ